jgi:hypothetical protein
VTSPPGTASTHHRGEVAAKGARTSLRGRHQLHPHISDDLYKRLKAYCARRALTDGGVVEAALHQYLDQSSDAALVMRRLDRAGRRVDKLRRDVEILTEFVCVWVRLWFAHTPQIPDSGRPAAIASATKRYEQLLEFVSKRLSAGQRLAVDLIGEEPPDEPEPVPASGGPADGG